MNDLSKRLIEILDCDICTKYLAYGMAEPLRCTGLNYDNNGKSYVGEIGTNSFKYWEDIVKEHEDILKKDRIDFIKTNKNHLLEHGWKNEELK